MAENIPNLPGGAVPPKPETSKIQPKKETVRINLPPKPSAAPTIKLPTLPPGGPSVAPPAPLPPPPTSSGARAAAPASPATQSRPAAQRPPAPVQRPVAAPAVSGLDKGLAIAAAVVALAAVGVTAYLTWGGIITPSPGS
jgi:hypothetical protein